MNFLARQGGLSGQSRESPTSSTPTPSRPETWLKPGRGWASIEDVLRDLLDSGEEIPQPWAERTYSGKFNLRVGERLHRQLAQAAAEQGLSLNAYVVRLLTPGHT